MFRSTWSLLDIEPTRDREAIRRAYARQLKRTNPEDDPDGFAALRTAFEAALRQANDGEAHSIIVSTVRSREVSSETHAARREIRERFDTATARLRRALRSSDSDEAAVVDAFADFAAAAAEGEVTMDVEADDIALDLLATSIPRSDPILVLARERFGWSASDLGARRIDAIARIVRRIDELAYRNELLRDGHRLARAYGLLRSQRRPNLRERLLHFETVARMRELLEILRTSYEPLLDELDAACVAAWDRLLRRPYVRGWTLWAIVLIVPAFLATLLSGIAPFVTAIFVMLVPGAIVGVVWHAAIAWPRHLWRTRWKTTAPLVLQFGYAPVAFALFVFAAFVPPNRGIEIGVDAAALAVAWWALVVGDPNRNAVKVRWQARLIGSQLGLVSWWLLISHAFPRAAYIDASVAFAACIVVTSAGEMTYFTEWFASMSARERGGVIGVYETAATLSVTLLFLVWIAPSVKLLVPLAIVAVVIVGLASRLLSIAYGFLLSDARSWLFTIVIAFVIAFVPAVVGGRANGLVVWGGTMVLGRVALTLRRSRRLQRLAARATAPAI